MVLIDRFLDLSPQRQQAVANFIHALPTREFSPAKELIEYLSNRALRFGFYDIYDDFSVRQVSPFECGIYLGQGENPFRLARRSKLRRGKDGDRWRITGRVAKYAILHQAHLSEGVESPYGENTLDIISKPLSSELEFLFQIFKGTDFLFTAINTYMREIGLPLAQFYISIDERDISYSFFAISTKGGTESEEIAEYLGGNRWLPKQNLQERIKKAYEHLFKS